MLLAVLFALALCVDACGTAGPAPASGSSAPAAAGRSARSPRKARAAPAVPPGAPLPGSGGLPDFGHVFVIVMENMGATRASRLPYVRLLQRRFASATDYFAVAHPSLPNYLALTSGAAWVHSDCWSCFVRAPNLGGELSAARIGWGAYMEGLPAPCWLGPLWPPGLYAGKHDPFRYYLDVRGSRALCLHIRPLSVLTQALPGPAAGIPRFVWVTPNLCHDGHDCPASFANAWLSAFVPRVLASPAWRQGGVLFITWDEAGSGAQGCCAAGGPAGGGGGRVLTLVIAPGLPQGLRVAVPYNHYALLRTIEQAWGLPLLGKSASPAVRPMTAFWR